MHSRWSKYFTGDGSFEIIEDAFNDIEIWDSHTHLGVCIDGKKMSAEQLIRTMNKAGISKSIVFPFNDPEKGTSFHKPNERIFRAYSKYPDRIIPFFRLLPNGNWKKEFRLRINQGFRGIKLHPTAEHFHIVSENAMEIYEAAYDENIPILIHTGVGIDNLVPDLKKINKEYPRLRIILGHGAFIEIRKALKHLRGYYRLGFETSAALPFDVYDMMKELPKKQILYGSDNPYYDPKYYIEMIVHISVILNTKIEDLEKIFSGNARRWLGE